MITMEELSKALKVSENRKADHVDGIHMELLTYGGMFFTLRFWEGM
jgi:hypothetical protein